MLNLPKRGSARLRLIPVVLGLGILLAYAATQGIAPDSIAPPFGAAVTQEEDDEDFNVSLPRAAGISEVDYRLPVEAPLRGAPQARSRAAYDAVIDQFAVEQNPRYDADKDITAFDNDPYPITYCHTFVWDVTRALGSAIPYWVGQSREIKEPELTEDGQWEIWQPVYWLSASGINQWLNEEGAGYGWREISAEKAQELANLGHPTVASVYEPEGFGHIGVVRPGEMANGPALAQAGTTNVNHAHVYDFFPHKGTQFFVNDGGSVSDRS